MSGYIYHYIFLYIYIYIYIRKMTYIIKKTYTELNNMGYLQQ